MEAELPIIQGGMGVGISLSGLASAVANCGGIGVISATGIGSQHPELGDRYRETNSEALRLEIRKARSLTKGLLGVNILTALTDYGELAQTAFKEGIDFIFLGAGLPLHKPKAIPDETWLKVLTKVVPIVSSGRAATIVCRYWEKTYHMVPDGFVLEGPMAGGHLGFTKAQLDLPEYRLENLLPEVLAAVKPFSESFGKRISVVAGGGIFTGEDIHKFLALGADGVQMASRFVATHECDASDAFKQSYLKSRKEDLVIIDSPVGLPGRAIRNPFLDKVSSGLKHPVKCPWKCLLTCDFSSAPYCIAEALLKAKKGELESGFVFAGANAYRIDKIVSVRQLIDSLLEEYARCIEPAAMTVPPPVRPLMMPA